jgi:hypothetical protein
LIIKSIEPLISLTSSQIYEQNILLLSTLGEIFNQTETERKVKKKEKSKVRPMIEVNPLKTKVDHTAISKVYLIIIAYNWR